MSSDEMILFNNNLTYTLPTPSSVVTNRCKRRSYFQNRTYSSGQTMVSTWSTGADFVDLFNSALVIKLKTLGTADYGCAFGSGSVANLINNIRVFHRSGTQYTNTQKLNVYRVIEDRNCESQNWFSSIGSLMGYDIYANKFNLSENEHVFLIPLNKLHPFFSPHGGVMMPPQMASGLRVEIDQANIGDIFTCSGVEVPTDFEITDIYFDLDSVSLMDSASASVNTISQKRSLEYLYTDIFTSRTSNNTNASAVNVDVNKSVAYCEKVSAVIQLNYLQNNLTSDGYTTPYQRGSWWYQLGSNQYPSNQKIDNVSVAFADNLIVWNKMKGKCGERGETYMTQDLFNNQFGTFSASLELDTALALSAMPVTSSRTLRFEVIFDNPMVGDTTTIIFMSYLSSARSTLTSSRVDI